MKTYEKPKLMVLSISANDALCSTCTLKTRIEGDVSGTLLDLVGGDKNGNGIFDRGDTENYFASTEACQDQLNVTGYCKFTTADGQMLFTS